MGSFGSRVFAVAVNGSKGAPRIIKKTTVTEKGVSVYRPIHDAYVEGIAGKNDELAPTKGQLISQKSGPK